VFLLLKDRASLRVLPVAIGPFEAEAIGLRLQDTRVTRPLTHDLIARVLGHLEGRLRRVEITALIENTYYAQLVVDQAGLEQTIDSRASDAVALALRGPTPIYVAEAVLDRAGVVLEEAAEAGTGTEASEASAGPVDPSQLSVFKEFIDTLNGDDLDEGGTEPTA
jgi:bifunctional DNase/RNase